VFIGRHMYSEEYEDDFGFDDACCKPAAAASATGALSQTTLDAEAIRAAAAAHQGSSEFAPLPRAAEGSTCVSQQTVAPLRPPPPMPYSVA
jgi:hypothetical protein